MNSLRFQRPRNCGSVPSWGKRFFSSVQSPDRILGPTQPSVPKHPNSIVFYLFISTCFDLSNNFCVKYTIKYLCIPNIAVQCLALCIRKPPGLNLGSVTGYPEGFCGFRQLSFERTETEHCIRPRPCPFILSCIHYTPWPSIRQHIVPATDTSDVDKVPGEPIARRTH